MSGPDGKQELNVKTSQVCAATDLQHLPVHSSGGPKADARGRDVARQQHSDGKTSEPTDGENLRGEPRVPCPATLTVRARPQRATTSRPSQGHEAEPALTVQVIAAGGDSGDGPEEEARCQTQSAASPACADARVAKKRHRRRPSKKKRRWKPYYKLSWEERKARDEREAARAWRARAEMFAKGLPVAPYNTTQFIMEEHDREEPDLNPDIHGRGLLGACRAHDLADDGDGDGGGTSGHARGEYLQRDFSETYEKYHAESLQSMSKQELVREYLELEKCMSRLEEENARLRAPGTERVRALESELDALRAQNGELRLQGFGDGRASN
ncbi:protein HEXIM1-like [Electrophorus electricus]|uniref:HEXIM P-TEFb complex subunit 1 n=1 Tax=Electrophorus electricus TaxID=8005 RepID=A0AAY5ETD5_ELEEL|nr:protein HEXIM1-like [Electrophorus electricus]